MKQLITVFVVLALAVVASGQNPASNKAFFVAGTDKLILAGVGALENPVTILSAPSAIKTSSVGALQADVSLECALWTYNTVTATSGGGKSTSSARAGIKVWVEVDGVRAEPGKVVYCDRLQATGLQVDSVCSCSVPDTSCTCTVTDTITLDLFQKTKNANSFNFFAGPLDPVLHSVEVKAQGVVECTANGAAVPCPTGTLNEFARAKTAAAIGKRTVVLEEHNNWGSN